MQVGGCDGQNYTPPKGKAGQAGQRLALGVVVGVIDGVEEGVLEGVAEGVSVGV